MKTDEQRNLILDIRYAILQLRYWPKCCRN